MNTPKRKYDTPNADDTWLSPKNSNAHLVCNTTLLQKLQADMRDKLLYVVTEGRMKHCTPEELVEFILIPTNTTIQNTAKAIYEDMLENGIHRPELIRYDEDLEHLGIHKARQHTKDYIQDELKKLTN